MVSLYNPHSTEHNMSHGAFTPHYIHTIKVTDSLDVEHDIVIGFLKRGNRKLAAEIYCPIQNNGEHDIVGDSNQITSGNLVFDNENQLLLVQNTLWLDLSLMWRNKADTTSIHFTPDDWGNFIPIDVLGQLLQNQVFVEE